MKKEIDNKHAAQIATELLQFIETANAPIFGIDNKGKVNEWNQTSTRITNFEKEDVFGKDLIKEFITDDYKVSVKKVLDDALNGIETSNFEFPLFTKEGKKVMVLLNASTRRDSVGKIIGVFGVGQDITEIDTLRKESVAIAKELLQFIETANAPIFGIDNKGKVNEWNQTSTKITNFTKEDVFGKDLVKEFITDDYKASVKKVFDDALNGIETSNFEFPLFTKKGKKVMVLLNASTRRDSVGKIIGVFGVGQDITEIDTLRKEAVAISKELLQFIETANAPIFGIDNKGKVNEWNQTSTKITNFTKEDVFGKDLVKEFITDEYKVSVKKVLDDALNGIETSNFEFPLFTKQGKKIMVLLNASTRRDSVGKIIGVFGVGQDITEIDTLRKESVAIAKYSLSLIEASLDPLITISTAGKITDMNEALANITGLTRKELTGTDFFDYFTEPQKAREVYQEVFAKGSVADSPLTLRHKDGKLTDVLFNGSVYKDDRGNVLGVVVVARDVTDQKRIATELTEAKVFAELATVIAEEAKSKAESATRIAEDAVKAKQQFLSNMSHEIRTPMNAIIGFTKVVLKTHLSAKQKEYLTAIKMSGDALIVLINDILDLAKVDAGKMTFVKTPFKMALSISAMLHLFETKIQEKNLELVKEYDNKIPEVLVGDPIRLHQIILNLVSNAVKFTTKGKIIVSVHLLNEDEEQVTIEFAITDTGIGIPQNKIEKIFENFQQASSGTSRLYGGTGLGLAIVKQLVEPQGGSIRVKSKIDVGSTFSFILNFQKTKAKAELETEIEELDTNFRNIKVLVVEDIPLNQLLMKTLLDDFGFECDIASNGKIAIEKLQTKYYDIILMDLQMPEMNGFEATEYIRNKMNSKIPIIALTADVTTVDLAKCKAVGMNDYIAKPVDEKLLYSKIVGLSKKPVLIKSNGDIGNGNGQSRKLKCIDLDYLIHRTKSNPALMMEMISLYLEQTPPLISAMKQSLQDKDWNSLHAAVHKIIPSFSIMGISTDFENMAKKIQEYASARQHTDEIHGLVLQLENVCAQACKELEEEFNTIKNTNL